MKHNYTFLKDDQKVIQSRGISDLYSYTILCFLLLLGYEHLRAQVYEGNLTLYSQASVNLFSYTSVIGYVVISGGDIADLSPLSTLTFVGGILNIHDNPALSNLSGLQNVDTVGALGIYRNSALLNIDSLHNLKSINDGGLLILENHLLNNIDGLGNITSLIGDVSILNNQGLVDIGGLGGITTLDGDLRIENNQHLTNIDGLRGISIVDGDLSISDNPKLTHLNGLANLDSVGGYSGGEFWIWNNDALENIDSLQNLNYVRINVNVGRNDTLSNLDGLTGISSLGGLSIVDNNSLSSVAGLKNISTLSLLGIARNPKLKNIDGLQNLTSVGELVINDNDSLTNINGLNKLDSIRSRLLITNNDALINLHGLKSVFKIGGGIYLLSNSSLLNIDSLIHVKSIGGRPLWIQNNNSLTSLKGLDSIDYHSITDLRIESSNNLSFCSVKSICEYLANGGSASISGNASGCNNILEVECDCDSSICLSNGIIFYTQGQIDSFPLNYPGCVEILGNISIQESSLGAITNLDSLIKIRNIQGNLSISGNANLLSLIGIDSLESIAGSLNIEFNPKLIHLNSLNKLVNIGGSFNISDNTELQNLNSFNSLKTVGGYLTLEGNDSLTAINELINLNSIDGGILVAGNHLLTSLSGLDSIDYQSISNLRIENSNLLSTCNVRSICDYLNNEGSATISNNATGCNSISEVQDACYCLLSTIVINANDAGPGSLREGINCASEGDTLFFLGSMISDTIFLDSVLVIDKDVTIIANPSQNIYISGMTIENTVHITSSSIVEIINLSILGSNGPYGVVWNEGNLILKQTQIDGYGLLTSTFTDDGVLELSNLTSISSRSPLTSRLMDIDNNLYKTVKIGSQWWMMENLHTTRYNDGTPIPIVTSAGEWSTQNGPAYCWYDNDSASYAHEYGAIYNYFSVADTNTLNVCPVGWHVPSDFEWTELSDYLGGLSVAGGKMKEPGTAHWKFPNTGASNESGFNGTPNGGRSYSGYFDEHLDEVGSWWTSTSIDAGEEGAWTRDLHYFSGWLGGVGLGNSKRAGIYVRCIKN